MIKLPDEKDSRSIAVCLGLFASVIKSGEPWTGTCQLHYEDALSAIERLNATAQPVSDGWVKCSERMPEDTQWCLVYTDYGQFAQCWSNNTNHGWLGDEISIPNIDVTHWMPLPAAPGGQDD